MEPFKVAAVVKYLKVLIVISLNSFVIIIKFIDEIISIIVDFEFTFNY